MGKLSIVTDSSENPEKLKINVSEKKIYYGNVNLIEGSLRYRPLHCSELYSRLVHRNWNKSETLFISGVEDESNEDEPILRYRKYTDQNNKPVGEIDVINIRNDDSYLSFPLSRVLTEETKEKIIESYSSIFDSIRIGQDEVYMKSPKIVMNTEECQESLDLVMGLDSYTVSLDLRDLIEYSSQPKTMARTTLSIRYSKINSGGNDASIYSYHTIFKAFEYDENRNLILPDIIEVIGNNLIRVEYLGGTIRLFPISPSITECIINDCTVIYGNFTR